MSGHVVTTIIFIEKLWVHCEISPHLIFFRLATAILPKIRLRQKNYSAPRLSCFYWVKMRCTVNAFFSGLQCTAKSVGFSAFFGCTVNLLKPKKTTKKIGAQKKRIRWCNDSPTIRPSEHPTIRPSDQ